MRPRHRVAVELAILSTLTPIYLSLWPERPLGADAGLALVALGLVALFADDTRRRMWGPPGRPAAQRRRHAQVAMAIFTGAGLLALGLAGLRGFAAGQPWGDGLGSLFVPDVFLTLALFLPWALMQQVLLQFYLLGRLRVLLPSLPPLGLAAVNGLVFGAVHLPSWELAVATAVAGTVWSQAYQRDRVLLPIAFSHALLGTAYFAWVVHSGFVGAIP